MKSVVNSYLWFPLGVDVRLSIIFAESDICVSMSGSAGNTFRIEPRPLLLLDWKIKYTNPNKKSQMSFYQTALK